MPCGGCHIPLNIRPLYGHCVIKFIYYIIHNIIVEIALQDAKIWQLVHQSSSNFLEYPSKFMILYIKSPPVKRCDWASYQDTVCYCMKRFLLKTPDIVFLHLQALGCCMTDFVPLYHHHISYYIFRTFQMRSILHQLQIFLRCNEKDSKAVDTLAAAREEHYCWALEHVTYRTHRAWLHEKGWLYQEGMLWCMRQSFAYNCIMIFNLSIDISSLRRKQIWLGEGSPFSSIIKPIAWWERYVSGYDNKISSLSRRLSWLSWLAMSTCNRNFLSEYMFLIPRSQQVPILGKSASPPCVMKFSISGLVCNEQLIANISAKTVYNKVSVSAKSHTLLNEGRGSLKCPPSSLGWLTPPMCG